MPWPLGVASGSFWLPPTARGIAWLVASADTFFQELSQAGSGVPPSHSPKPPGRQVDRHRPSDTVTRTLHEAGTRLRQLRTETLPLSVRAPHPPKGRQFLWLPGGDAAGTGWGCEPPEDLPRACPYDTSCPYDSSPASACPGLALGLWWRPVDFQTFPPPDLALLWAQIWAHKARDKSFPLQHTLLPQHWSHWPSPPPGQPRLSA